MNYTEQQYIYHLENIKNNGMKVNTRNAQTKRLTNLSIDCQNTPLIITRRTAWKNALREMEWFLSGSSRVVDLQEKVQKWWLPFTNDQGEVPNNYSQQFRYFSGKTDTVDQIQYAIDTAKNHPNSRRNVITTWNTADMIAPETKITNCHGSLIQIFVNEKNKIDLTMYQRSSDMVLGLPHNLIQYQALILYIAHHSGRLPGKLFWIGGDCHIYPDHEDMVSEMVEEFDINYMPPDLQYKPTSSNFNADDFSLTYKYEPKIKKSLKMTV